VREGRQTTRSIEKEPELVSALVERGVNLRSARTLVAQKDEGRVREKIALFDWLLARKDPRIQRSAAGFLYQSIAQDFALPEDYVTATAAPKPRTGDRRIMPLQRHTASKKVEPKGSSDRAVIDEFWNSLGVDEQERIERELVEQAPRFHQEQYLEGQQERGLLFQAVRQAMIDGYVRTALAARSNAA
jgi:hypothetical protein